MNHVHQFQVKRLQPSPDSNHYPFGDKSESFMDVLIDGRSMYDMLKQHDRIPCFGWGNHEFQQQNIDYFLLEDMHPYLYYRYPLMVCSWCGDEDCGFISVFVERTGDLVTWQDFKMEPDDRSLALGPFTFT
ncbi:oxidoreductase [Paenibacillus hunanensis]|uniref:Oxidoreductase n=1 Tax=Paenibacillus hunanensis TaxID=539262 RepID=A0ABU1IYY3_9BACL|nr:oxidoreductase [Paenibacillus hunanensis]MDR6244205.1 hypothetical protein [Paenibacillus hunanensis]GGJ18610.1 hypothetical protein GCM10008022_29820 [Paenibacillus hunanensis]